MPASIRLRQPRLRQGKRQTSTAAVVYRSGGGDQQSQPIPFPSSDAFKGETEMDMSEDPAAHAAVSDHVWEIRV